MKALLAPSLLAADFSNLEQQVGLVEAGGAHWLHVDVMDGHFVPNLSFGTVVLQGLQKKTALEFDVHLMVEHPDNYLEPFQKAGAHRITVHQEACVHLHRTIERIQSMGMKAGVSLNPATPLSTLEEVLPMVDMVLLMSVNPGFGGQRFIPSTLDKIARLKAMITKGGYPTQIQVDGGVVLENVSQIIQAGADVVVVGSAIFGKADIQGTTAEFIQVLNHGC